MKYEELVHFLERQMSMSHVYQPLLVRALVDSGGNATLPQLAQVFLTLDESQLPYYEKRIKEMPKALKRHGVIEAEGQIVSLTVSSSHSSRRLTSGCSASNAFKPSCRNGASAYGITVSSMKSRFRTVFVFWF